MLPIHGIHKPFHIRSFHLGKRANQKDCLSDDLRYVLQTVGLQSIRIVYLQGMATGRDAATTAVNAASDRIGSVLPDLLTGSEGCCI